MNPLKPLKSVSKSERFLDPFLIGFSFISFSLVFYFCFHPNILSELLSSVTNNCNTNSPKVIFISGEIAISFVLFLLSFLIGEVFITFTDFFLVLIFGGKPLDELIHSLQEWKFNIKFEKLHPHFSISLDINHLIETNDNWLITKSENLYRQSLFTVAFALSLLSSFCLASLLSLESLESNASIIYFFLSNSLLIFILLIIILSCIRKIRSFISSKKGIYTMLIAGLVSSIASILFLEKLIKLELTLEYKILISILAILILLLFFKGIEYRAAANFYLYLAHLSYRKTKSE